jgi:hypothetical protein
VQPNGGRYHASIGPDRPRVPGDGHQSTATWCNRQVPTCLGMAPLVREGGQGVRGAHVLNMVRAHYPLINFKRFELGYPKEVGLKQADELRIQLLDLLASIMDNINLCGTSSPAARGPASLNQLPGAAVSTSQSPVLESLSAERLEATVPTS